MQRAIRRAAVPAAAVDVVRDASATAAAGTATLQ
jgi:hypothetical protein